METLVVYSLLTLTHDTTSFMQASSAEDVHLVFFLPAFEFAVLYSQPSLVQVLDIRNSAAAQGALHINEFRDPEVDYATGGHEPNPCEYKALKLSQALGSDGLDRCPPPSTAVNTSALYSLEMLQLIVQQHAVEQFS